MSQDQIFILFTAIQNNDICTEYLATILASWPYYNIFSFLFPSETSSVFLEAMPSIFLYQILYVSLFHHGLEVCLYLDISKMNIHTWSIFLKVLRGVIFCHLFLHCFITMQCLPYFYRFCRLLILCMVTLFQICNIVSNIYC